MIKEIQVKVLPIDWQNEAAIRFKVLQHLDVKSDQLNGFIIRRRSIDARQKQVYYNLVITCFIEQKTEQPIPYSFDYSNVSSKKEVAIIGAGPAGLFAALRLIELGFKPIVFERGKDVRARRRDLAAINKSGIVNPESNYCFGEGGAGTYSDGKLYTRSTKRGSVERILNRFVEFGADADILINTHPHIGTNKLPHIISAMRERILACGGEVIFDSKITDLNQKDKAIELVINHSQKLTFGAVLLATGHSARDIYEILHKNNILIERKPFALGVRVEHPQSIIDQQQYHCETRDEHLPAASYSLVEQVQGRGVFSFCMCPGGIIAPAATAPGEVVVNGWSPSKRNNAFANSGFVTQIEEADYNKFIKQSGTADDALTGLRFQAMVEQNAFRAANNSIKAPAQRLVDFVNNKSSKDLPDNSYLPGLTPSNISEVLPEFVHQALRGALKQIGKKMKQYYTNEAVMVATESRTSSPVRIPRDVKSLQHPMLAGLFPCGEGAGYAGGIVSAAIDGENCANAISIYLKP